MSKVFCIEDDSNIRELIEYTLCSTGFDVKSFECGSSFFEAITTNMPDLILLDIMLPDIDGMEILKKLKDDHITKGIPVIMLTAKSERMDKIKGLDSGADDYITKPFDVLELISRIKAVLRRSDSSESETNYKKIRINNKKRLVYVNDIETPLTFKEYELLKMLVDGRGDVIPREKIVAEIWGTEFEGESRTLDVHIRTLRQKLGEEGNHIETVRNVGYRVE